MLTHLLPSGHSIPMLGLGTFNLRDDDGAGAIAAAIDMGYSHLDTAAGYDNEEIVGRGIRASRVSREELFVTTKVGRDHLAPDDVRGICENSLMVMQVDYVDLLLIHWPNQDIPLRDTLGAFGRLVEEGKVRHVGISNFNRRRVDEAVSLSPVPIVTNQVEYHPHLDQEALRQHCAKHNILLTAYSPLAQGKIITDPTLSSLAQQREKSAAQVALRWLLQKGIAVIPKASSVAHMEANLDLFDWYLSDEEMDTIASIETVHRVIDWWPGNFDEDAL